jgi:hypothetical protein
MKALSISYLVPPKKKTKAGWAPVAHSYNPSYSGGRHQEDCDSKPAQAKTKNLSQKKD